MDNGHYLTVATVKNEQLEEEWYSYNDMLVQPFDIQDLSNITSLQEHSYMLFYSKQPERKKKSNIRAENGLKDTPPPTTLIKNNNNNNNNNTLSIISNNNNDNNNTKKNSNNDTTNIIDNANNATPLPSSNEEINGNDHQEEKTSTISLPNPTTPSLIIPSTPLPSIPVASSLPSITDNTTPIHSTPTNNNTLPLDSPTTPTPTPPTTPTTLRTRTSTDDNPKRLELALLVQQKNSSTKKRVVVAYSPSTSHPSYSELQETLKKKFYPHDEERSTIKRVSIWERHSDGSHVDIADDEDVERIENKEGIIVEFHFS